MLQDNIMPFSEYVQHAKDLILQARTDLNLINTEEIMNAVSPFEWKNNKPKNGVLLSHGLYDSPFMMHDIGQHFFNKGFLVRGMLLPGHGTQPEDLLNIHRRDWLNAVHYGIKSTAEEVENLYLVGYSIGAALSILSSEISDNIRGLILFAPAVQPKHRKAHILRLHKLFTWVSQKAKWYVTNRSDNFLRYADHPYHAGHQAILTMQKAKKTITNKPVMIVASEDDETISAEAILNYFSKLPNSKNRLIYYSSDNLQFEDPKIEVRNSSYENENILDFSHRCLTISPNNYYLGREGKYIDYAHYQNGEHKNAKEIKKGAITVKNLTQHTMERLSYNPDFDYVTEVIDKFIESI